ncbi:MAG: N-acetylmuramoyl-L-alanine amidase [Limisphaerales bacterium]
MKIEKNKIESATKMSFLKKFVVPTAMVAASFNALASTDYPGAVWRPACAGKWYTSGSGHQFTVIHDMEGYYLSSIAYLNQCGVSASIHYAVNGKKDDSSDAPAGEVSQCVREAYYAWHAGCWNTHSFGTEHEGFASNPAWFTPELYNASAALQKHLCNDFSIAKDRNHVIGHDQKRISGWPSYASANFGIDPYCNTHTDPGLYWDWTGFMNLINDNGSALTTRVHVFGRGGDGACWIRSWYSSDGWHDWYSLGGSITGGPDAYSRNSDHVAVVVNSSTEPGHIKQNVWTSSGSWGGWSDLWTSVGGNMTSDPTSCARGTDSVHIFARGPAGDCMKRSWNATTGWAEWASEGGSITGAPDCCSKSASHLYISVLSATEPGHIKGKTWDATTGWGGWVDIWTSVGGNMDSDPSVVNRGTTKMHVFARKGNDIWIRTNTEGSGWAEWYSLGAPAGSAVVGAPDAYSRGDTHVAVVVRNQYNNCWKKTWTSNGGWEDWESLGQPTGGLTSSPGATAR